MDIFTQIMRLPFDVVASSLEPFLRMAREAERATVGQAQQQTPSLLPRPAALVPSLISSAPPVALTTAAASASPYLANGGSVRKDDMNDNLVKLVRYSVVFVKPDEEKAISEYEVLETVNYPTTETDLAAVFLVKWVQNPHNKPKVPKDDDLRYLKVRVHVVERYPVEEKFYEKRQTVALETIAVELKNKKEKHE